MLEEWRMTRDAVGRMQEAHWALMMQVGRGACRTALRSHAQVDRGTRMCLLDGQPPCRERSFRGQQRGACTALLAASQRSPCKALQLPMRQCRQARAARPESAGGRGAGAVCPLQGSRYADRLPIGTEAVIRRCPATTVAAFYERWYRPQHMAIVAVGDFEDQGMMARMCNTGLAVQALRYGHGRRGAPGVIPRTPAL